MNKCHRSKHFASIVSVGDKMIQQSNSSLHHWDFVGAYWDNRSRVASPGYNKCAMAGKTITTTYKNIKCSVKRGKQITKTRVENRISVSVNLFLIHAVYPVCSLCMQHIIEISPTVRYLRSLSVGLQQRSVALWFLQSCRLQQCFYREWGAADWLAECVWTVKRRRRGEWSCMTVLSGCSDTGRISQEDDGKSVSVSLWSSQPSTPSFLLLLLLLLLSLSPSLRPVLLFPAGLARPAQWRFRPGCCPVSQQLCICIICVPPVCQSQPPRVGALDK